MQLERLLVAVFLAMCLYQLGQFIVKWFRKLPIPPDPWDAILALQRKVPPIIPRHPPGNHGMKKLLTSRDLSGIDVNLLKGLLEQEGIPCMIKNEYLAIAIGDLPPAECFQELWLLDADDYPHAREIWESWRTATPLPSGV